MLLVVGAALIVGLLIPTTPGFRGRCSPWRTRSSAGDPRPGGFIANLYADRGQLYSRLGKLETDIEDLRRQNETQRGDLTAAASFINRLGLGCASRSWTASCPPTFRSLPSSC